MTKQKENPNKRNRETYKKCRLRTWRLVNAGERKREKPKIGERKEKEMAKG